MNDRYTPITVEERDRLLAEAANAAPVRWETCGTIEGGKLKDFAARLGSPVGNARSRAQELGWNIDPENSPGNPHAFGTNCVDKRCGCHGRTFAHYRRGA